MSNNNYFAPLQDGYCYDWIEFYNSSDSAVNLKGAMLSDNTKAFDKWKVPADCIIQPHGYVLIYFSGLGKVDEYGNIHASFKLSSKGETLVFSSQTGAVIQQLTIPACETKNISYGIKPNVSASDIGSYVFFSEPSPLAPNSGFFASTIEDLEFPTSGVVINEYMTKNTYTIYDSNSNYSDWIELYNTSSAEVDLSGYSITDKADGKGKWFFPKNTVIAAGGYLVVFCSDELSSDSSEIHANFNLSEGDVISLYSISGKVVDSVKVAELNPNVSCGRTIDGSGFKLFASPTPGRENSTYAYEMTVKLSAAPYSQLYISEAMCVSDNDGGLKRDFIEIHNAASQAVSLKDYGLSKDAAEVAFTFPDITLGSGEYAVVYCTGNNYSVAGKTMQASFKLNQGGERLYLFDAGKHVIDSLNTGKQTYGHSSGRLSNEKNMVYVFGTPTPGEPNDTKTYLGYAPMPQISSDGGYLQKGTKITISAPEDCNIYYTTTGDKPSSKSKKYSGGIAINKTTIIKAICTKKGYLSSQIAVSTFLVEKEHSIPVVSIASDDEGLFSAQSGILSKAKNRLVPGKENFYSTQEREATFEYFIDGKKAVSFNSRFRLFGETSRKCLQKGFAVLMSERYGANEVHFPFFDERSVDTYSALVIRPSGQDWLRTHMRDELCARIARDTMKLDIMDYTPAALYINGQYWGLYYIRDKLNEDYLVNKYGMTKGKIDIVKWEKKQQAGNRQGYLDLCNYCEEHDLTKKKNYEYVCSQVDIESLMDWWIMETYVGNNDTGNVRCYRDQNNGKWKWMLFDLDYCFTPSTFENNYIKRYMLGSYHGLAHCNNSIIRKLLQNEDFRDKFITRYCYHMKTTFQPDHVLKLMDELSDSISDEIPRQAERWGNPTVSYWGYNSRVVRNLIKQRPEIAKKQIKEAFRLSEAKFQKYYKAA